jgi:hypothetical protein
MKTDKTALHPTQAPEPLEDQALLQGLREADRFYQGFQRQGSTANLMERVRMKLGRMVGEKTSQR